MVNSNIEVKLGEFTFSGSGSQDWLSEQLRMILDRASEIIDLNTALDSAKTTANENNSERGSNSENVVPLKSQGQKFEGTTNSIAAAIGCNSGPDLVKAASLHLVLVRGKEKFTRKELIDEMKTSTYHKSTYVSNLSSYLKTLFKDFLNENAKDTYSIKPQAFEQYRAQLAAA